MWFGTDNGLSRFDGYEFKNYSAIEGLVDPVVFDILEDSRGASMDSDSVRTSIHNGGGLLT